MIPLITTVELARRYPEVLRAHADFGGDLTDMLWNYHLAEVSYDKADQALDVIEAAMAPNTPGGSGTAREAPSTAVQPAPQPPIANVSHETPPHDIGFGQQPHTDRKD